MGKYIAEIYDNNKKQINTINIKLNRNNNSYFYNPFIFFGLKIWLHFNFLFK